MQSKHDVMKTFDDVWTLMKLTSLYHGYEKKIGIKFSKCYVFFKLNNYTSLQTMQLARIHTPVDKTCTPKGVTWFLKLC